MSATIMARRPAVSTLSRDDLTQALSAGWRDFKTALPYSLACGAIYALGGILIAALLFELNGELAVYPLATGFALIAPFVAAGTYEISRRLECGENLSWPAILTVRNGFQELGWMALVTLFALVIWCDFALLIYVIFFGTRFLSLEDLATAVATTSAGTAFFVIGNLTGAAIAFLLFSLTAVSCPMLIDRDVDAVTAMLTSIEAVRKNPRLMLSWAILIAFLLAAATMAFFIGLVLVLPLLGHTTWHFYRRLVPPAPAGQQTNEAAEPRQELHRAA